MRKIAVTLGTCLLIAAFSPAFAAPDAKTFAADASAANNGLVKLGGVGQAKGRVTTQTFSVRMARDFNRANVELAALGATSDTIPAEVQTAIANLAHQGDDDFDAAFGAVLVKLLTAEIAEYQSVADAKSGPASDLAASQLPVLRKTLDGAKHIAN